MIPAVVTAGVAVVAGFAGFAWVLARMSTLVERTVEAGRVERADLLDRIQAPDAARAQAWEDGAPPPFSPPPSVAEIDLRWSDEDASVVAVDEDLA